MNRYAAVAALVALVGVVVFTVFYRATQSRTASPASAAPSSPAAAPAPSRIAFVAGVLKPHPNGAVLQNELYVMNADGQRQAQAGAQRIGSCVVA